MKPIYYILICCLLGLYSCSKKECNCEVTEYKNYTVVGTRAESFSYGGGISKEDEGDCIDHQKNQSVRDTLGNYPDLEWWDCE